MAPRSLVDWPSSRTAARHVITGLRAVNPAADFIYMREGRWLLLERRPNREVIATAAGIVGRAIRTLSLHVAQVASKNMVTIDRRSRDRLEIALVALQGARFVAEYRLIGDPDSYIVHDYQRMTWLYEHLTDDEVDHALNDRHEQAKLASRADLTDPARGRDAWRYVFTRSHAPGISLTTQQPHRSGFKTIRAIA